MRYPYRIFGFVWLFPITVLVWFFYILPLFLLGHIKYDGFYDFLICKFKLIERDNLYCRLWERWAGWSGPCVMIYKPSDPLYQRVLVHEYRHCMQQFVLGIFFYLIYAGFFVWHLYFGKKDPYYDNPLEIDARKYAESIII